MLIFDFDGVIMDSLDEVTVNTFNLVTGDLISSFSELPADFRRRFRANRWHAITADRFYAIGRWCLEGRAAKAGADTLSLDELIALQEDAPGTKHERELAFFSTRMRLMEADRNAWLSLHAPFEPLFTALKNRGSRPLVILSTKNRGAILELLNHFKLELDPELVFSGDNQTPKLENFRRIQKRFPNEKLSFVDDAVENILALQPHIRSAELSCLLADWGYLGPDALALARQKRIRIVGQEEAVSIFQAAEPTE